MLDVGRLCMKVAGRDAGLLCVIVDVLDDGRVLVDGQTRRRACNVKHVEPLQQVVELKKGALHAEVVAAFQKLKIEIRESKPKESKPRPVKVRKKKAAEVEKGASQKVAAEKGVTKAASGKAAAEKKVSEEKPKAKKAAKQ